MRDYKVSALVPMRANSKRVPNKNILNLNGKPVCCWILESLSKSNFIDEIIVNTDSDVIKKIASKFEKVKILNRPESLIGENISIQPLIEHDLKFACNEHIIQTHATNPLLKQKTIDNAIKKYFENLSKHDSLFSVTPIKQRFYLNNIQPINHNPKLLIPTQNLKPIFHENSCIYIFSKKSNFITKNRLGHKPIMFEMDYLESSDIDEWHDFYWTDFLLKKDNTYKKLFLSYPLNKHTPSYGDRDKFNILNNSEIIDGEGANTSTWNFSNNHIGTHIDTPFHFFSDGKKILDYNADEFCYNKIKVLEKFTNKGELLNLSDEDLEIIPNETEFLIIKTGYGKFRKLKKYHNDNPGLPAKLANILRKKFKMLKGIGFDFISLTSWNYRAEGKLSHKSFLGKENNFLIVEDMDLSGVNQNTFFDSLIISPLRTSDGNGSPVTIIASTYERQ